jgi:hypothetical protein
MENVNDDFIVGLVKGKIGEVMDRMRGNGQDES